MPLHRYLDFLTSAVSIAAVENVYLVNLLKHLFFAAYWAVSNMPISRQNTK